MFARRGLMLVMVTAYLITFFVGRASSADEQVRSIGWDKPKKKLIEVGWDTRPVAYLRKHIRKMEQVPLDGVIFKLDMEAKYRDGFTWDTQWTEEELKDIFDDLAHIEWKTFTDNFVLVYWGERTYDYQRANRDNNKCGLDWYDDAQWENILHNIKLMTKAVVIGRCKGICFDPEVYHRRLWNYDPVQSYNYDGVAHRQTKTYEEYCAQVRKRGRQYIEAIQSVMPNIRILNFIQFQYLGPDPHPRRSPKSVALGRSMQSLYPAFLNGMLEAAGPEVVFIEGNEAAYSYTSKKQFDRAYTDTMQRDLYLVAPENRRKYKDQVRVGSAIFMDNLFGLGQGMAWLGTHLSAQDRAKLFEHNLYHAMDSVDEYVWLYSERMDWWPVKEDISDQNTQKNAIPEGALEAIRSAKQKILRREKLGFSMEDVCEDIKVHIRSLWETSPRGRWIKPMIVSQKDVIRSEVIHKSPGSQQPPVIDGKLDDAVWQEVQPLAAFVPPITKTKKQAIAKTTAQVIWDDRNLYVAFTCHEPKMDQLQPNGTERDTYGMYKGDSLEMFIYPYEKTRPFHLFMINPNNARWDAIQVHTPESGKLSTRKMDNSWNPQWKSAVVRTQDRWTVELAIPWEAIGGTPQLGEKRRVNLARNRIPEPAEWTAWTVWARSFGESDCYGTWIFDR